MAAVREMYRSSLVGKYLVPLGADLDAGDGNCGLGVVGRRGEGGEIRNCASI